jgi:hypothetical protein
VEAAALMNIPLTLRALQERIIINIESAAQDKATKISTEEPLVVLTIALNKRKITRVSLLEMMKTSK